MVALASSDDIVRDEVRHDVRMIENNISVKNLDYDSKISQSMKRNS